MTAPSDSVFHTLCRNWLLLTYLLTMRAPLHKNPVYACVCMIIAFDARSVHPYCTKHFTLRAWGDKFGTISFWAE